MTNGIVQVSQIDCYQPIINAVKIGPVSNGRNSDDRYERTCWSNLP